MIPAKLQPLARPANSRETREAMIRFLSRIWNEYHSSEYTFIGALMEGRWRNHPIRGDRPAKIRDVLSQYPADHYNLYFCPNAFDRQQRQTEYANSTRYAWCDIDANPVSKYNPQPNILWETSPGRHQGLWNWDQRYPGNVAQQYSRNIVTKDGGDRNGWSVTKMLRIPGTINHKPAYNRPWVRLLSYSADEQRLPKRLATIQPTVAKAATIGHVALTGLDALKVIQRYQRQLGLFARTLATATQLLYPDRSEAIFVIVSAFVKAGANDAEIICVLLANPHFFEKHGHNPAMAERETVTIRAKVEVEQ